MTKDPILVVDDDDALRESLAEALAALPVEITVASGGAEAVALLGERRFAVVVTDLVMKGVDGFAVLAAAKQSYPNCRVVMLTGHGGREVAVQAMEKGATYYVEKPVDLADLRAKVRKSLEDHQKDVAYDDLRGQMERTFGIEGIVGQDPKIQRMLALVRQIAGTAASVLILGPSGTGKELVARAVHNLSPRSKRPFVAINCGGMSEGTIESELFGHVKGAFTGAVADREGKFEYAAGGTLFLDEVGEMPLATQIKLLRVLEERSVARLGDNKMRPVDVRVLAATNADLLQKVKDGIFRQDLYFRLKVVTIELPPLRERRSDIKLLIDHFLGHFCKLHGKDVESIDRDALVALVQYDWPGNVRELRNAVESMVVRAKGNILTRADLPPEIWAPLPVDQDGWQFLAGRTWGEVERNHIRVSLELTSGNRQKAARAMGLSERTLYRKIKEYGL
ncbi:MAG: sigma-54-dependent Fis family transcriptional regulator [Planctomycetes bacterium]|nr:sigma-54-dependent Fis family transcriptional regulator [Planctomycetota bacterium]MCC7066463.1 sigma-54-dependent Fis family transcriptional regulator [Planctomycetota bacterium]